MTTAANSAVAQALSTHFDNWGTTQEDLSVAVTTRFLASIQLGGPRTSILGSDDATDSSPMIFGLIFVGFVYGAICGLIASTLAERKGRSAGGFFLLGLLLGIFAIAVAAVVGPGQPCAPPGMRAVECRRCSARQNIDDDDESYEWWTVRALDHPDSAQLLRDYPVERRAMVGFDDPPDLDRQPQYDPPSGLFLVAYTAAGETVACGGIRAYSQAGRVAEIRKMFVVPRHRNRGLARHVLAHLESFAAAQGTHRVLLETGSYNRAATHLYLSSGYDPIPPYVPGRPDFNRAFAETLN